MSVEKLENREPKKTKPLLWPLAAAAALIGLIICFGRKITFSGSVYASYTENYFEDFVWTDILVFLLAAAVSFAVLYLLGRAIGRWSRPLQERKGRYSKKLFWLCFAVLCLAWLPFFLMDFPGSVLVDSHTSIAQVLGYQNFNNHFPVLYTLFVGIFIKLGQALGSLTIGVFLYSLTQYLLMAAGYAFFLTWLYQKGAKKWFVALCLAFYALMQTFAMFAVIMWKDPLFTLALLALTVLLVELVQSGGVLCRSKKFCVCWAAVLFGVIFLRNNGIFIVVGLLLVVLFVYRKQGKRLLGTSLCLIVGSCIILGPVYSLAGVGEDTAVESLGIPIQQIAYVVVSGGEMTEEEAQTADTMLPLERYEEVYTPCIVDSIKWDEDFRLTSALAKDWVTIGIKNFPAYVKAYCLQTFGFWKIGARNGYGDFASGLSDPLYEYTIEQVNLLEKLPGGEILSQIQHVLRIHFSAGTLFVLWLVCLALLLYRRQFRLALVLLPGFLLWGTLMLATPVAFSLRYVYLLLTAMPLVVVLPRMMPEPK
ncbi:MAG: DUF6020 family protein [Oscillospiraceae bacterium]|nr:DUF6020 family protein [Oscillospiraceae bacterium]